MSRCKEGPRKWKALLAAKRRELKRPERRIKQLTNALTKLMTGLDRSEGVAVSVLGNLTNVRRKARTSDKDKKASQKINHLPFNQIKQQHAYKSLLRQVRPDRSTAPTLQGVWEGNSSYRAHRGLWRCKECGATIHADLNGAGNILKNYLFGHCGIGQILHFKPPET